MTEPTSPPPVHDYRPDFLPAYLGNGLVGLRVGRIPFLVGSAIVNGFAGQDANDGVEGFTRAPYPVAGDVELAGVRASAAPELVRFIEQRYDFATAELTTVLRFEVNGVSAEMTVLTFCSRSLPSIVLQEISVQANDDVDLALVAGIDPTEAPGHRLEVMQPPRPAPTSGVDGVMVWESLGGLSRCGLAYATMLDGEPQPERTTSARDQRGLVGTTYRFRASRGRTYRLRLVAGLVPDLAHHQPGNQAGRVVALALAEGWDRLRDENRRAWSEIWRGRIEVDADEPRWQEMADAAMFYLLTSVHSSSPASTSLFGLAFWPNYHYYHGHVMWDIETFAVPPLLLLEPEAARAILDYRARHLEAAAQNARLLGWRGTLFPWESCPLHGEEVAPGTAPQYEGHVAIDVALAFARYVNVTGDTHFLRDKAFPVLAGVAEWIESRSILSERGYEIRQTVGVGEGAGPVDNDAYVNMSAAVMLREAAAAARRLGSQPDPSWEGIADRLVLPMSSNGRVIRNHDGHRIDEAGGGTPEGAAGIFPTGYHVPEDIEKATFRFAVEDQAPRYVGAPMLSAFLGYYAVRAGRPDLAPDLLQRGYADFIDAPFRATDEFPSTEPSKPRANPMFANLGGFLMTLLYGYPGLDVDAGDPADWCRRDVVLPPGWRSIAVDRLWVRGAPASLEALPGRRARLEVRQRAGTEREMAGSPRDGSEPGDEPPSEEDRGGKHEAHAGRRGGPSPRSAPAASRGRKAP